MGLVVYPKKLAVEHAGGDDCHHDAGDPLDHPLPLLRVAETASHPLSPFPLPCGSSPSSPVRSREGLSAPKITDEGERGQRRLLAEPPCPGGPQASSSLSYSIN